MFFAPITSYKKDPYMANYVVEDETTESSNVIRREGDTSGATNRNETLIEAIDRIIGRDWRDRILEPPGLVNPVMPRPEPTPPKVEGEPIYYVTIDGERRALKPHEIYYNKNIFDLRNPESLANLLEIIRNQEKSKSSRPTGYLPMGPSVEIEYPSGLGEKRPLWGGGFWQGRTLSPDDLRRAVENLLEQYKAKDEYVGSIRGPVQIAEGVNYIPPFIMPNNRNIALSDILAVAMDQATKAVLGIGAKPIEDYRDVNRIIADFAEILNQSKRRSNPSRNWPGYLPPRYVF